MNKIILPPVGSPQRDEYDASLGTLKSLKVIEWAVSCILVYIGATALSGLFMNAGPVLKWVFSGGFMLIIVIGHQYTAKVFWKAYWEHWDRLAAPVRVVYMVLVTTGFLMQLAVDLNGAKLNGQEYTSSETVTQKQNEIRLLRQQANDKLQEAQEVLRSANERADEAYRKAQEQANTMLENGRMTGKLTLSANSANSLTAKAEKVLHQSRRANDDDYNKAKDAALELSRQAEVKEAELKADERERGSTVSLRAAALMIISLLGGLAIQLSYYERYNVYAVCGVKYAPEESSTRAAIAAYFRNYFRSKVNAWLATKNRQLWVANPGDARSNNLTEYQLQRVADLLMVARQNYGIRSLDRFIGIEEMSGEQVAALVDNCRQNLRVARNAGSDKVVDFYTQVLDIFEG